MITVLVLLMPLSIFSPRVSANPPSMEGPAVPATPGSSLQTAFSRTSSKGNTVSGQISAYQVSNSSLSYGGDNDPNWDYYLFYIQGTVSPKPLSDWSADTKGADLSGSDWTMQFDAGPAGDARVDLNE